MNPRVTPSASPSSPRKSRRPWDCPVRSLRPSGAARDDIVRGARIFAVADTFDAMTSERPYRGVSTYQDVCGELARCAGLQFDPLVVEAFMRIPETTWTELRRDVAPSTRHWKSETGL